MKIQKEKKYIDISLSQRKRLLIELDHLKNKKQAKSILFSRGKKADRFFTEDSKLYITPSEQEKIRRGVELDRNIKKWDALSSRVVNNFVYHAPSRSSVLLEMLEERYEKLNALAQNASESLASQFSLIRLWNLSIVGSIMFGMVMMTFVYRYLGQGAAADQIRPTQQFGQEANISQEGKVLGAESNKDTEEFAKQVQEIEKANNQQALEKQIGQMVKGYPIERMVPYIAKKDRTVAAFLIAIAKKESGWGQHHPVLNGQDCYNYWGYRGQRKLMGSGGHTCFNSPQDAVDTVAKRLTTLVEQHGKNTPEKMVNTWKCGTSCAGDPDAQKWISDVTMYFNKLDAK